MLDQFDRDPCPWARAEQRRAHAVDDAHAAFRRWKYGGRDVEPSPGQAAAIEKAVAWARAPRAQVHRIFGPAGTGKSSTAGKIAREVDGLVLFGAYTGKAAHVLKSKGLPGPQTLHSLLYVPEPQDYGREKEVRRALRRAEFDGDGAVVAALRKELADLERERDKPRFSLNPDSLLGAASLLIVDEVSMVGQELADDLLSFGVPVLVLGDPEQLPPIGGAGALVDAEPDSLLTEIHRQAEGSSIIDIATHVRKYGQFPHRWPTLRLSEVPGDAQILCGTNATRWAVTRALRELRGRPVDEPAPGDRIIILKNNRELGIFNGQIFYVVAVEGFTMGVVDLLVMDEFEASVVPLRVHAGGFVDQDGQREAEKRAHRGSIAAATFADCLSVHKAQGSEWSRVAVIDEGSVFGRDDPRTPGRWRYTAASRASNELVVAEGWSC